MISLRNVTVKIGNKTILNNISCSLETGDFVVIVGPNGAGKSTFFDVIAGRRMPTSGSIIIDGTDVTHLNEQQRAPFISRLFQETKLNGVSTMTVAQNLSLSLYKGSNARLVNGMNRFAQISESLLASLHLNNKTLLETRMESLSGGQRQLISFIMATMIPPKLLLLDEPTAALDPASATRLLTFAAQYIKAHKMTTLLITHDPHLARVLGNKVWILENGTITKEITGDAKKQISPEHLIGHINYEELERVNTR